MRPIAEQDHYEILEVSRNARPEEIERRYRLALATYADDSLAGYSVIDPAESQLLRDRIDAAYRVLSDPKLRGAYDEWLETRIPPPAEEPRIEVPPPVVALENEPEPPTASVAFEEVEDDDSEFDGPRLRRVRLARGLELEEIASITKVNPTYLRFLEEERFVDLPAPVYVRGFVSAYASCVGLDARRVAASYMRKFLEERAPRRR